MVPNAGIGFGEEHWTEQRPLSSRWRLLLVDRCGTVGVLTRVVPAGTYSQRNTDDITIA
jgi:hypothetical protein